MIEHTRDFRRVKRLSDANPPFGLDPWDIKIQHDVFYLVEKNKKDIGVWCFEPHEEGYLMHAAMGPECRGGKAVSSALDAIDWFFTNTSNDHFFAAVPEQYKHVHVICRNTGLWHLKNKDRYRVYTMTKNQFYKKAA